MVAANLALDRVAIGGDGCDRRNRRLEALSADIMKVRREPFKQPRAFGLPESVELRVRNAELLRRIPDCLCGILAQ